MADHVLVTGGAGYIGSHACLRLAEAGFTPVAFDNLSNGREAFVQWGPLERGDVRSRADVERALDRWAPVGVIHFAALIEVGLSFQQVGDFYETNVGGALTVLRAMQARGVQPFVFSSTCATYGEPQYLPLDEAHPQAPINPYGRTKLMVEQALKDLAAHGGIRPIILRYFNAAGADPEGRIGERHDPETHALPIAIEAAMGRRDAFSIFGEDYDTRDGTAERDYVHVLDLADAHVLALRRLLEGAAGGEAFNLGTGGGVTVRELLGEVARVSGRPVPSVSRPRRPGDAPRLVADNRAARAALGWTPSRDIADMARDAWGWHGRADQA
ncbi:UDP-glucose 4-epimerase GalE [Brevundimonas sp.]|uniref:UDP-glucose 4-epimerase GalE n=1 Tax=Brevundimonas sp. TaxID=1871086 RepID=UPI002ED78B61